MRDLNMAGSLRRRMAGLASALACGLGAGMANAAIVMPDHLYADHAFASRVISDNVPPGRAFPTGATLAQTLLGADLESHIDTPFDTFIELGFDPGALANIPGADLAVYEMFSDSDPFLISLTVGGPALQVPTTDWVVVGTNRRGWDVRVVLVDLGLLGVPDGAAVSAIVLSTHTSSVEFTAVGSLLPEPSSAGLVATALAGLAGAGAARRRRFS